MMDKVKKPSINEFLLLLAKIIDITHQQWAAVLALVS
jgi:hypothetical protein